MKEMNLGGTLSAKVVPEEGFSLDHYYAQLREALSGLTVNGSLFFKVEGSGEPFVFENVVLSDTTQAVGVSLRKVSSRPRLSTKDKQALHQFLEMKNTPAESKDVVRLLAPLEFAVLKALYGHGGAMYATGYVHEHSYDTIEAVLQAAVTLQSKGLITCPKGTGTPNTWMEITEYGRSIMSQ